MDKSIVQEHLLSGYYSFATYAIAFWPSHIQKSVQLKENTHEVRSMSSRLEKFLQENFCIPTKPVTIESDLKGLAESLKDVWPRLDDIQMAMSATARQLHAIGRESSSNEV